MLAHYVKKQRDVSQKVTLEYTYPDNMKTKQVSMGLIQVSQGNQ